MIITDGLENDSHEWTRDRVFESVTRQTDQFGWTFTYLGANQDAIAVGRDLGVPMAATMDFAATGAGTQALYAAASAAVSRTRSGGTFGYTEDERDAAVSPTATATARKQRRGALP
jgi:hypothetical protein